MGAIQDAQDKVMDTAIQHGFWDVPKSFAHCIGEVCGELGEALSAYQHDEPVGEELADAVIYIMDTCAHFGVNLEEELVWKMDKNEKREFRHGRKI